MLVLVYMVSDKWVSRDQKIRVASWVGNPLIFWIYEIIKSSMCYVTEKTAKSFGTNTLYPTHRDFRSPRRVVVQCIRLTD